MKSRAFTTRVGISHMLWLSNILGLDYKTSPGIDLADNEIGVEVKSRRRIYNHSYAVHHYQIDLYEQEHPNQELFWAFVLYEIEQQPGSIRRNNIEGLIKDREAWFMEWGWVKQFPVSYPRTGPFLYPKIRALPDSSYFSTFERSGGALYVPKGSVLEDRLLSPKRKPRVYRLKIERE